MKHDICICEYCIEAIRSRGEKVIKLESLYYDEKFDEIDEVTCEWCEEETDKSEIFKCIFA